MQVEKDQDEADEMSKGISVWENSKEGMNTNFGPHSDIETYAFYEELPGQLHPSLLCIC